MTENNLISPMLDNYDVGGPISDHNGVRCYPAMRKNGDDRYIVKSVSVPASKTQLDALLLTGALPDAASALTYFKSQADGIVDELETLRHLSTLEGFLPYTDWQVVPKDDGIGFDVYMIGTYKRTLRKHFQREPMTHLMAVNLGLDLCAALAVCRRCGYMYVDLKPNNIYLINDREFRIGDLGFLKLDSLKYATIPDKYRSQYSAPELQDPFAPVSSNVDIYAAGLILYQAYNGGVLPFDSENAPTQKLEAPLYADYEMSEIIMKACDPDPAARWQSPLEMGQALVSYMQCNGANDTPIIPAVPITPAVSSEDDIVSDVEELLISDDIDLSDIDLNDIPELEGYEQEVAGDEPEGTEPADEPTDFENLSFLNNPDADETSPENNLTDVQYDEISDELNEILSQADELVSHPVPEPAVAPEAPEITVPEIVEEVADESDVSDVSEDIQEGSQEEVEVEADADPVLSDKTTVVPAFDAPEEEDAEIVAAIAETLRENDGSNEPEGQDDEAYEEEEQDQHSERSVNRVLRNIILFLLLAIIAVAGFLYYRFIYLQPIYSISIDGDESSMVVEVKSDTDEALLSVVCSDAHGHQLSAPVVNGVATFTNLSPDTGYNIYVVVDGFHKLTGETAVSYSTPAQTNIVQFTAVTGSENGSVILSFSVVGPNTGEWSVAYSAADEEEKVETMLSNMITLTGLTVGKEYTFTLIPGEKMYITGTNEIKFTASDLVYAEDVNIISCVNGQLTTTWNAPADVPVSNWTVRCYNDSGYNETIITSETTAVFEGIDPSTAHTVEVVAAGMSVSERAYMAANAVTLSNFQAVPNNNGALDLTWESSSNPDGGWILLYSVEGIEKQVTVPCSANSAQIRPMVPDAVYNFTITQANGDAVLTAPLTFQAPEAQDFSGYGITRSKMSFELCRYPGENWDWDEVPSSDYTNTFTVGEKVSVIAKLHEKYGVSDDVILSLFVFKDENGNIVSYSSSERSWRNMWYQFYSEINIPEVPDVAGNYTLCIYFNGKLTTEESITIQ